MLNYLERKSQAYQNNVTQSTLKEKYIHHLESLIVFLLPFVFFCPVAALE